MEPITLLVLAALGGAATAGAVHIAVLTLPRVRAWFQARRFTLVHPDLVGTTIVDLMAGGSYRTVQGVFNTRTRQWVGQRAVESYQLGHDLAQLHRNQRIVIHHR